MWLSRASFFVSEARLAASQPCSATPLQGYASIEDDVNRLRGSPPTSAPHLNIHSAHNLLLRATFHANINQLSFCGSRELLLSQDSETSISRENGCPRSSPSIPQPNRRPLFLRRPIDSGHRAGHDSRALRESWQCIQAQGRAERT